MKKIFYSVALAALALVASCQREVAPKELTPADFATVTFAIDAAQPGTKAVADGLTATKLYVGVYDVTAESKFMGDISELGTLTLAAGKYDFSVRLVKGQSYKLVFWAQAPDAPYTVTIGQEGATVVATTTGAGSAENRDAFFKTVETGVVGEDFALPVKLERAVAQVNVIANDWTEAAAAGVTYTGASMSIAGLPDTIDLLTGTYSGSATYAFTSAAAPAENFGDRKWIASNYVLAADEEGLKAVEFVVDGAVNGAAKQWSYAEADKVNNVAITRNYRTNISGNLFTASATFNVVVDPIFATPDNEKEIEVAKDVTATNAALEANMEVTGQVAYVIETVKVDDTTIIIPEGTQASDLTFTIASFDTAVTAPTITINDGGTTAAYAGNITVNLPTDVDVDLVTINAPGAHVVISNGTITKVVAATSGTTLVVGGEAKINILEVASGHIHLAGKVVNIVRAEGNTDEVTYVSLVAGYSWTNQATDTAEGTKVVIKVDDPSEEASEDPSDEPAGDEVFAKVTSISAGDYLIVWEGESPVAFDGSLETLDASSNTIPVVITDGTIEATSTTKASVFTFAAIEGGYSVKSASGQFIGGKSATNTIVVGAEAILNTVAFEEGNAVITSNTSFIQYNKSAGQERFRYYKSGTSTQQPVALYKLVGASTETSEDPSQEPVEESDIVAAVTESLVIDLGGEDAQIEVEVSDPAEGAAVAYASANEQVVTVSKDGVVHAVAAGETTVTVTITAEGYKPLEKVVDVTVLSGTLEDPYTVEGVIAYIDGLEGAASDDVYVKGIVSELTNYKYGPTFNSASFWITSDGSADAEAKFEAYSCYYLGGSTSKWYDGISTQIEVGQEVVIFGKVTKYNTTYETASKSAQIYSINGATSDPAFIEASNVNNVAATGVSDAKLNVAIHNADGYSVSVAADGSVVTAASYAEGVVTYSVAANSTTDAKQGTITITLSKTGAENVVKVVTVSQVASGTVVQEDPFEMGENISWELGSNAYDDNTVKVNGSDNGYKALKIGTSSKVGSFTLKVPAGTKTLSFYALSWSGKVATISIKNGDTELFGQQVAANTGVTGNSPFTVADVTDDNKYSITFEAALEADTDLVFTTTGSNSRAIFFGIKAK